MKQIKPVPLVPFVLFYSFGRSKHCCCCWWCCAGNSSQFWGKSSLDADRRERGRARMPSSARCCLSGMPSPRSACQAHAGAQAGRKRQSSWKTGVWSEPRRRLCQAEQLWPASASASLACTRRCMEDPGRKDATIRGPLVRPGRARGQTPCGGEWAVWNAYSGKSNQPISVQFLTVDVWFKPKLP